MISRTEIEIDIGSKVIVKHNPQPQSDTHSDVQEQGDVTGRIRGSGCIGKDHTAQDAGARSYLLACQCPLYS